MSRVGEFGLALYKLLKKSDSFRWTEETHKALITKPPVLASPEPGETLHRGLQHDLGSGAGGTRTGVQGAVACLLHQQHPLRL
jgi:hypothetical protein